VKKTKGEIALEELVRLIIFLLSLVVIGVIFSNILIPKIFEKNSEIMCKKYVLLKNDNNPIKRFIGSIGSLIPFSCVSVNKEFVINNKEEVLYYLLIYFGKTCEITNSNKKELRICPYTLVFKPNKNIKIERDEILSLMYAKLPYNNEVLSDYCTHQFISIDKDLDFSKFEKKAIKICYSYENNEGLIKIRTS